MGWKLQPAAGGRREPNSLTLALFCFFFHTSSSLISVHLGSGSKPTRAEQFPVIPRTTRDREPQSEIPPENLVSRVSNFSNICTSHHIQPCFKFLYPAIRNYRKCDKKSYHRGCFATPGSCRDNSSSNWFSFQGTAPYLCYNFFLLEYNRLAGTNADVMW
jgi:hypothetical protein